MRRSDRPKWRHTRPFWGALLIILGGFEILLSERAPIPLIIHIGLQGLAGYVVPLVIVLLGLLLLFHPVQRTFYSLLVVVLSLVTWITSNLGGFFVGMLLGVIGGSLAFAWRPRETADQSRGMPPKHRKTNSAGIALVKGELTSDSKTCEPDSRPASAPGDAGSKGITSSSLLHPSGTRAAAIITIIVVTFIGPPTKTPSIKARPPRAPFAAVAIDRSWLSGASADFEGLTYAGIAEVRTAHGVESMLKFTMKTLRLSGDITLTVSEGGHASTARDSLMELSGEVELYTTRISGSLAGLAVTFDPGRPPSGLDSDLVLRSVTASQLFASAEFARTVT